MASELAPSFPTLPRDVSYGLAPDGEGVRYFADPTPGEANGTGTTELGPVLADLTENPDRPIASETDALSIRVSAQPSQTELAEVKMFYRFMYEDEIEAPMQLNDSLYAAEIPLEGLEAGQMVRWRVEAKDVRGVISKFPPFEDSRDAPEYHGTVAVNSLVDSKLPVLEWFVESASRAGRTSGTRCSVFHLGEFYDNVFVRLRGGIHCQAGKEEL